MNIRLSRRQVLIGLGGVLCFGGVYCVNSLRQLSHDQFASSSSVHFAPIENGERIVRNNWILPNNFRKIFK